jgi:chromosome segregation ATPase
MSVMSGAPNQNANVRAKLLALDDMVESLSGELGYHKREVQMLRSEKESLETVLNTKTGEVRKTLGHELKKVEEEMKRHYSW